MNIMNEFEKLGELEVIWLYPAQEVENDPFEHTTDKLYLSPIPVKALIKQFKPEALRWKFYGQIPVGSKEVICDKKYKNLFKIAKKIKIGSDFFKTYRDDESGFLITERKDYISVVVAYKGNNIEK